MRQAFAALDDLLFERLFQPAVDVVVHRMRRGREAATCLCLDLASLAWITSRAQVMSDAVLSWNVTAAFAQASFLLLGLLALISLRTLFRRTWRKSANPLRLTMVPHRAVGLLMLAARLAQLRSSGLADSADLAMLVFASAALYLGACAERPPARRSLPGFAAVG